MPIPNWPGSQINDINEFRTSCYRTCHEKNPTDSGWYEKEDECGRDCASKLRAFQKASGKNPCAQRLQAPVFWFTNESKENYQPFASDSPERSPSTRLCVVIGILFFLCVLCMYRFWV